MKRLRAGPPIHVSGVQLIPVERTCVYGNRTPELLAVVAAKEPVAVVIRSARGAWALDLGGRETSLSDLLRDAEDLQDWVS